MAGSGRRRSYVRPVGEGQKRVCGARGVGENREVFISQLTQLRADATVRSMRAESSLASHLTPAPSPGRSAGSRSFCVQKGESVMAHWSCWAGLP